VRHSAAGRVAALTRYPVKSMAGEALAEAVIQERGLAADRGWAVYTPDGGVGSGKTTRRFRRVDGLLDLQAHLPADGATPSVRFPDGSWRPAGDPATDAALSDLLGGSLTLRPEHSVRHHDECPVHLITTSGLRALAALTGRSTDPARFRANVLLETEGDDFVEDAWYGRILAVGDQVRLRVVAGMPRCVMLTLPQPYEDLPQDAALLKELGRHRDVLFGVQAEVVRAGIVRNGDRATFVE
jgi:uncharacterized protein YcbX